MSTFFRQTAQAMIAKHIDHFPLLKLDQVIDWQPIEQYLNRQRTRYLRDHRGRIATIADGFIAARNEAGEIVGYIVGPVVGSRYITDDLFKTTVPNPTTGGFQTVLGLAVHPDYRGKDISTLLLNELARVSRAATGRENPL